MRVIAILAAIVFAVTSCSGDAADRRDVFSAQTVTIGEALPLLGWNMSVANLRFEAEHVLVDVDASVAAEGEPHAAPEDIRFGLYGALAHPLEANGIGGCQDVTTLDIKPLSAPTPDRMTGTVCIGPLRDQSQVRGIYAYSPRERTPGTTVAYPAAFPVGLPPATGDDAGLAVKTTSIDAFRADGAQLAPAALGDPAAFQGQGYMLLGLEVTGLTERYRDESAQRGGPMMVFTSPTRQGRGLSRACDVYGSSVLVLPDESRDGVHVTVSLCTQGEINHALLYATVSLAGTRAGLWTTSDD